MKNPNLLLTDKLLAADAMIIGIMLGKYGQPLTKFVNATKTDYRNARRSVNIMDKADLVAGYAKTWEGKLKAHKYGII